MNRARTPDDASNTPNDDTRDIDEAASRIELCADELWIICTRMLRDHGSYEHQQSPADGDHVDRAPVKAIRARVLQNVRTKLKATSPSPIHAVQVHPPQARVLPAWAAVAAVLLVALLSTYTAGRNNQSASLPTLPPNGVAPPAPRNEPMPTRVTVASDSAPGVKPGSERDAELAYRQFKLAAPATPSHANQLGHETAARCRKRPRVWRKALRAWRTFLRKMERPLLAMPIVASIAESSLPASREQMDALLDLGRALAKEGDTQGAKMVLQHIAAKGAGQAPRAVAGALSELALLAGESKDTKALENILRTLDRVRASYAKQIEVWGVLGEIRLTQGDRRGALRALKRAERTYNDALKRGGEHKVKNVVKAWLDLKLRKLLEEVER